MNLKKKNKYIRTHNSHQITNITQSNEIRNTQMNV